VSLNRVWRTSKYIVSDEYAFVYFVVPKVACSSIKTALLPIFDVEAGPEKDLEVSEGTFAYRVHGLFGGSEYQVDKRQLVKGFRDSYRHYFKFAFVRNPWDRLFSCYSQKLAPGGQGLGRERYAGQRLRVGMSFSDFVEAVCQIPDEEADPHFRSQYLTVCGNRRRGRILANFVGRFENLEEEFAFVVDKIGANGIELRLPHLLSSNDSHSYRDFYDRRLARLVGERYQRDTEIFCYSF
jgi:hypothetical protein